MVFDYLRMEEIVEIVTLQDRLQPAISVVVGAVLAWIAQKVKDVRVRTNRRKFWAGESKVLNIVYGTREIDMAPLEKAEALKIDILNVVNVNDVLAVANASSFLHKFVNVSIKSQNEVDDLKKGNLLLIGGPVANSITKEILELVDKQYSFNIPDKDTRHIVNRTRTFVASSQFDEDFNLVRDVAWFYRGKNPYDKQNVVVIVSGCFGYGTEAAINYLISEDFYKKIRNKQIDTVEGILEVEVKNKKAGWAHLVSSVGM